MSHSNIASIFLYGKKHILITKEQIRTYDKFSKKQTVNCIHVIIFLYFEKADYK